MKGLRTSDDKSMFLDFIIIKKYRANYESNFTTYYCGSRY